jgi:N-acetylgalactosamine-6-sulfatase
MLIGKWHLGHRAPFLPLKHGFNKWFGAPDCHFHYGTGTGSPNIPVYRNEKMIGRFYESFGIDLKTRESNYTQILKLEAIRYGTYIPSKYQSYFTENFVLF